VNGALDSYAGARSLVLGASGFIGRWVSRTLSASGASVISAVRYPPAFEPVARQWGIAGDVVAFDAGDPQAVRALIGSTRPDVAFNLVGYGVDRSETDTNVMAHINGALVRQVTAAIAEWPSSSGWTGRRLVHVGSALEYGLATGVIREDTTPLPHTEYGRTKLDGSLALAELAARSLLPSVVARVFTVFGPGEHRGRLFSTIREMAAAGTVVHLSAGTQRRDFAYVEDVAEGLLRLGLSSGPPGEVVNLATGQMTTVRDFAATAAMVLGLSPNRLTFGSEPIRSDEMQNSGVDVLRLHDRTGWHLPADLATLIERAIAFEAARVQELH
jgi:nucleoside-diphosphate-sugar epimerase